METLKFSFLFTGACCVHFQLEKLCLVHNSNNPYFFHSESYEYIWLGHLVLAFTDPTPAFLVARAAAGSLHHFLVSTLSSEILLSSLWSNRFLPCLLQANQPTKMLLSSECLPLGVDAMNINSKPCKKQKFSFLMGNLRSVFTYLSPFTVWFIKVNTIKTCSLKDRSVWSILQYIKLVFQS